MCDADLGAILDPRTGVYRDTARCQWVAVAYVGGKPVCLGACGFEAGDRRKALWERQVWSQLIGVE